jgi:hypothetical protein
VACQTDALGDISTLAEPWVVAELITKAKEARAKDTHDAKRSKK